VIYSSGYSVQGAFYSGYLAFVSGHPFGHQDSMFHQRYFQDVWLFVNQDAVWLFKTWVFSKDINHFERDMCSAVVSWGGACAGDCTRGVYRVVFSGDIRFFIHVEDFEPGTPNPGEDWHLRNLHVPMSEMFVSWGTACLWDDDIVIYTGEERGGVLMCGSRLGLGRRWGPAIPT
jgi:hypothetical protein